MTQDEKIDLALQSVLNAGGLSLKHLPDDNAIKAMREAMSKLLTGKEVNLKEKMINAINVHCVDLERCIPTLLRYGMTETAEEVRKAVSELRLSCAEYVFTQDNPDI